MKLLKYILLVYILMSVSCTKDIEYKGEDISSKLVVNAVFNQNNQWAVRLSKSENILNDHTKNGSRITNASVYIYNQKTGDLVSELKYDKEADVYSSNKLPKVGVDYKIEVSHSAYPILSSYAKIPEASLVNVLSIEKFIANEFYDRLKIRFKISDLPNEEAYYIISLNVNFIYKSGYIRTENQIIYSNDLNIDNKDSFFDSEEVGFDYILLPNSSFEGKDYIFSLSTDLSSMGFVSNLYDNDISVVVELIVNKVDYKLFKYFRSVGLYPESKDNPFAQPVQIYNNIDNGLGVFGGVNQQKVNLNLTEFGI